MLARPPGRECRPLLGHHADQLLLHAARRQAEGLGQGVPDAARGDQGRRDRPVGRRVLLPGAHLAGQGRGALRQVRPRVLGLLQGRGAAHRLQPGHPAGVAAQDARARAVAGRESGDREDGLGRADGDAEEAFRRAEQAPRRRQQDDRHRRHQPVRRLRLQPAGHPHRARQGPQPLGGQGVGPARRTRTTTTRWSSARATSRSRCGGCAASRARAPTSSSTSTTRSIAPPPTPACSTSR